MNDDFLSVSEFAKVIKMHVNSIYKLIKEGRIYAFKVSKSKRGSWRIPKVELIKIATRDFETINESLKKSGCILTSDLKNFHE